MFNPSPHRIQKCSQPCPHCNQSVYTITLTITTCHQTPQNTAHCLHVYTRATTEHSKHRTQKEKDHSPIRAAELSWRNEPEKTKKKRATTHEGWESSRASTSIIIHRSPCIPHTPHYHLSPALPYPHLLSSLPSRSCPPSPSPVLILVVYSSLSPLPSLVSIVLSPLVGSLLMYSTCLLVPVYFRS